MSGVLRGALVAALTASVASFAARADAQLSDGPARLPAFGRSAATVDDSTALRVNPAGIARLPGAELRWSGLWLDGATTAPFQGHAFGFAFPIPLLPIATGLRWDMVDPPSANALRTHHFLTWALAMALGPGSSLGLSVQQGYGPEVAARGRSSFSVGAQHALWDYGSLGIVVHDANAPASPFGGIARSFDFSLAARPLGTRQLELTAEAKLVDAETRYWVPRGVLALELPFGRLRGDVSVEDPAEKTRPRNWLASASVAVNFDGISSGTELSVGTLVGNRLGQDARYRAARNLTTELALRSFEEQRSLRLQSFALKIELEQTPGSRGHVALLRRLWDTAEQRDVAAVVLSFRAAPAGSLARAEELRDAVLLLRERGKKVLCQLEEVTGPHLFVCAAADQTLMTPAGSFRFYGLAMRQLYFKELLDRVGVRADFARVADYKAAPEQLLQRGSSEKARANRSALLLDWERSLVGSISSDRNLEPKVLRRLFDKAPYTAKEAVTHRLVDGIAYDDELDERVQKLVGAPVRLVKLEHDRVAVKERYGTGTRVALVYADGEMVDGKSSNVPLVGQKLLGGDTIAELFEKLRLRPDVGAIVLRIDSPGGSVTAADRMWRAISRTAKTKPVVVSMAGSAASGGYYIAAPATRIFASRYTLTGSIGVFNGKVDVEQLLTKLGIDVETMRTGPRADAESVFRPFTDDERVELHRKVMQYYDVFLDRVVEGRKLPRADVHAVAQGQVWTGQQALSRKLVDRLGGLREALEEARSLAGLSESAPVLELPPPDRSLLGAVLGGAVGLGDGSPKLTLPPAMRALAKATFPLVIHPAGTVLARLPFAEEAP